MSNKFPSQVQDKFTVRFPEGMRDKIAEQAKKNNRSMNSEIIYMLEDAIIREEQWDILSNHVNENYELYNGDAYQNIPDYTEINDGLRRYIFTEAELKQFIETEIKKLSSSMIKSAKRYYIP
ncbi:Arc family DNA-binding protein [Gilliamella sp. Nev5-1]|uniref:Arc family DNA-binding protein n=1 Tax=Gilliamella sp. Nev5-1 TaxID=3120251 RepID=UPI0009E25EEA|nr:Arc family DNA-binding protein [Gilliamella apicola]